MPRFAKTLVFTAPQQPLELREFALPKLQAGEVLVEVTCCTLCGSDLHSFAGRRTVPCPSVLGHEIIGRVAELPAGPPVCDFQGTPLNVGDRVTWSVAAACERCFFCQRGLPQKCERLFKYGHERISDEHPLSGGLSQYCHLAPGTAVVQLPEHLPDFVACPANCATATTAAALRIAGEVTGQAVLIQGAGMLGLTAAAMARSRGARAVIVADLDAERVAQAPRFGATHALTVSSEPGSGGELHDLVADLTDGRGVDAALEMSGASAACETAIDRLRIGGRLVLVGAVFPGRPVQLNAETVVRKLLRIEGLHNYTPADLVQAVEFLAASHGSYPLAELVSARYPLEAAATAFARALETKAFRVAVQPS